MKRINRADLAVPLIVLLLSFGILTGTKAYADESMTFSVTVPTSIPVYVDSSGNVRCADNLKIINNAPSPIAVTNIEIRGDGGWTLTDMGHDFKSEKTDKKIFAMSLAGCQVPQDGNADLSGIPPLNGYEEYTIEYNAAFPAISADKDNETIGQCIFTVGYETGRLRSIKVVTDPVKTEYGAGERFDPDGMIVMASYFGMEDRVIENYTVEDGNELAAGQSAVTVSYEEKGIRKSTTVPITVRRQVQSSEIISYPYKTSYFCGETFDASGLAVMIRYADGTAEEIKTFECKSEIMTYGMTAASVEFKADAENIAVSFPVNVERRLSYIEIKEKPIKQSYFSSEQFQPDGAVINAVYECGERENITNAVVWSKGTVNENDKSVYAAYSEGGITKSVEIPVTVSKKPEVLLSELRFTSMPFKTAYKALESFDASGAHIEAIYSDGSSKDVTPLISWSHGLMTNGTTEVTASYSENGRSVCAACHVTVERSLSSLYISSMPIKTVYFSGEYFDKTGMTVMAVYEDGTEETVQSYSISGGTPFVFSAPPSTVKTYVTTDSMTFITTLTQTYGINEADFRRWNGLGSGVYIRGSGVTLYLSDPAEDEALTCIENQSAVEVSYSESGRTAACRVPVTVKRT